MTETHPWASAFRDRHGKQRWRFRRAGKTKPLPGQPGEPAFEAAYLAAIEGRDAPSQAAILRLPSSALPRSMAAAWRAARRTPDWMAQAPATRFRQNKIAETFLLSRVAPDDPATWAQMAIADLRRAHVKRILADRSAAPHAARHLLTILRKMIHAALDDDWIDVDPTHRMRYRPEYQGWRSWTEAERTAFETRWPVGTTPRLAYALALWLGNRRGDIVRLRPSDVQEDTVRFRQRKTGRAMILPVTTMLRECLDAADLTGATVLTMPQGGPFDDKYLTDRMRVWTKQAGLPPGCTIHGLRKTLGKMLAEEGATTRQIMDTLGHTEIAHAELYSRDADQARLAADGMRVVSLREHIRRGKPHG